MKYTCHVPIEQYGFISAEVEGTAEDAVRAYDEIAKAAKSGNGIPSKDFNHIYDHYRLKGSILAADVPLCEDMSKEQKASLGDLKRSLNRNK